MTYGEIVSMITGACNSCFKNGTDGIRDTILECATRIYIEQTKGDNE